MSRVLLVAATVAIASLQGAATTASAQVCGESYTVRQGDTLSAIARKALGDSSQWLRVYEWGGNAAVVGPNPNLLNVGDTLALPRCVTSDTPPVYEGGQPTAENSEGFRRTIEIVTASDYAPFTDEDWHERGMATHIVETAFAEAGLDVDVRVDFINDWGSHLTTLIKHQKYDFGFPWLKPDCTDPSALEPAMRIRCEYVWSDPIYTVTIALFAPKGLVNPPESFEELEGRTICRPTGYYTFDLAANGLRHPDTITLVRPNTPADCFRLLDDNKVDFVSINRFTGQSTLADTGLDDTIEPLAAPVDSQTLHLVAHRDNAEAAQVWMSKFNEGLHRMEQSGLLEEYVSWHLKQHRDLIAGN